MWKPLLAGTGLVSLFAILPARHLLAQQRETLAWAPVPAQRATWTAPNKPIWKLSELLAKHKGQANWTETVVSDNLLHADYISMAPGVKTLRQFHPDNRAWWIVQDGQIRFTIEGQEPFVASKGYLVQVPYRNVFSLETVGSKPSLRLEVNIANAKTMYPIDETPEAEPGIKFVKVRISGKGKYDQGNKPYIDFNAVVAGTEKQRRFIRRRPGRSQYHYRRSHQAAARGGKRQRPFSRSLAGVLDGPAGQDRIQDRLTADFCRRSGRYRLHARADLASRSFRGNRVGVPAGDEWISGPAARLSAAGRAVG
jgi:mannose-6-phosphate isomerase-like protein (cupin superfamily)